MLNTLKDRVGLDPFQMAQVFLPGNHLENHHPDPFENYFAPWLPPSAGFGAWGPGDPA